MTLMALVVAVTAGAQNFIHDYPWNPDWDNDNFVGSSDLTGFLSAFGSEFGNPPEPCDYDGTPLEEWWGQAIAGDIIVDSVYFEVLLVDIAEVFYPGCPEAILDTVEFAWNDMVWDVYVGSSAYGKTSLNCWADGMAWQFEFDGSDGEYRHIAYFPLLTELGFSGDGFFGGQGSYWKASTPHTLPFPESWYMDDEGIHIESGWNQGDWPYYANYLHILPYWHYAE